MGAKMQRLQVVREYSELWELGGLGCEMADDVGTMLQGLGLPEYSAAFAASNWTMSSLKVRVQTVNLE